MGIRGRFTVRKLFPDFYVKNQMVLSVVSVVVSESLSVPEPVSVVLSESELLSSSVPVSTELLLSVS